MQGGCLANRPRNSIHPIWRGPVHSNGPLNNPKWLKEASTIAVIKERNHIVPWLLQPNQFPSSGSTLPSSQPGPCIYSIILCTPTSFHERLHYFQHRPTVMGHFVISLILVAPSGRWLGCCRKGADAGPGHSGEEDTVGAGQA